MGKGSLFEMGEVSNLSEGIGGSRMDFPWGNRGGMLGKV